MKLEIKNLSVTLDNQPILKDVSLEVRDGEFLSLLGPSGCGKSTMLKTIAGLLPVSGGEIFLGDQEVSRVPTHKRGAVVVFQDLRMFPHMTALENVAFPLKMQGVPRKERLKIAAEYLKKVQLDGREDQLASNMSGGQQQRVALARALAAKPKLLLLDEPFSALDENLREDMRILVKRLQQELGVTAVLVTHDRGEALSMSDRVALMFDGRIAQIGTPREVYHRPGCRQVADYFGNCVYICGKVEKRLFNGGGLTCCADLPDGNYTLMLRPGELRLGEGSMMLTVEEILYRGGDTLVTLRSPDDVQWRIPQSWDCPWKPGDAIRACVDLSDPVLFPE